MINTNQNIIKGLQIQLKQEISNRKKAEKLLKETETRYQAFFEQAPDGIAIMSIDGEYIILNSAFAKMHGYDSSHEMEHMRLSDYETPESAELTPERLSRLATGEAMNFDVEHYRKDGTTISMNVSCNIFNLKGKQYLCGVHREITKRMQTEKALRESEQHLHMALKAANMVSWEWDISAGMIRYSSNTPEVARGEAIEPYCSIEGLIQEVHPEDREALKQAIHRTINEGVPYECEYRVKMLDGVYHWISGKGDVMEQRDGKSVRAMGISQDITEKKKAENELKESHEQMKNLTKHLQLVREQERIKIARELHDELGQALVAINLEVSAISRNLPASHQNLKSRAEITAEISVGAIKSVKRIISELRPTLLDDLGLAEAIRWQIQEYKKRCSADFDVSISPQDISLNDDLSISIFRIFQESITNAVRHSNATRISVNIKKTDTEIELRVKDNGIGISKDNLTQRGSFGIMGMKERAKTFGGTFDISGIPGKGTTLVTKFSI